jgi:hypothetical protein
MKRLAIFLVSISMSNVSIAGELHLGAVFGYGYIPVNASPLEKGPYTYSGVYIGTKKHKLDIAIMHDRSDCNIKSQRIAYSKYLNVKTQKFFGGVEYLTIDRRHDSGCNVGAIISLPMPFIGYKHEVANDNIKLNMELLFHFYGVSTAINIGF